MQKVLIVGQTLELGRTEEVYGRGFSSFGCEVKHFNWQEAIPSTLSRSFSDKLAWRLAWQLLASPANQQLVELANQFKPDLVFVVSPNLVHPDSIKALKQHGLVVVFFTDNPLDTHHTHSNPWVRQGLFMWDMVFIWSQELVNKLFKKGLKKVVFHPFYSDVQYMFSKKQINHAYDVAFIGNWDDSRKREKHLKEISDCRLGVWGTNNWLTRCREGFVKDCYQGMCTYSEISDVLGSAKIGLNILRPQNEMGHNIRTFEIPATGTLMLSERSKDLLGLFEEDKEAVYFSSPEELNQKVNYLLENHDLIDAIAKAGYQKSLQYTIDKKISEILTFLSVN